MKYLIAPSGWSNDAPNPFSEDGAYGPEWSCFCLSGTSEKLDFCGSTNGLFTFCLGPKARNAKIRLADFLRYESAHGRKVILSFPEGVDPEAYVQQAIAEAPDANAVRESDPRWVVHSTNGQAWKGIQRDGGLKALSVLRDDGTPVLSVGYGQLGEPPEYAEHIVLGRIGAVNPEHVVASQQRGCIFTEEDVPYEPGVRIHFDNHRIIRSGLGVRDGLHTIKVHRFLPLEPHMVAAISRADVDPQGDVPEWTPRTFWTAANEAFRWQMRD